MITDRDLMRIKRIVELFMSDESFFGRLTEREAEIIIPVAEEQITELVKLTSSMKDEEQADKAVMLALSRFKRKVIKAVEIARSGKVVDEITLLRMILELLNLSGSSNTQSHT